MWKKNCSNKVISDALTFSAERNVSCTLGVTLFKTDAVMTFLTRLKHLLLKYSIDNNNNNNNNNNLEFILCSSHDEMINCALQQYIE